MLFWACGKYFGEGGREREEVSPPARKISRRRANTNRGSGGLVGQALGRRTSPVWELSLTASGRGSEARTSILRCYSLKSTSTSPHVERCPCAAFILAACISVACRHNRSTRTSRTASGQPLGSPVPAALSDWREPLLARLHCLVRMKPVDHTSSPSSCCLTVGRARLPCIRVACHRSVETHRAVRVLQRYHLRPV